MGKNKLGGKKHKKSKNSTPQRKMVYPDSEQQYALVLRMLGMGKLEAETQDKKKYICSIRGTMRKRIWISEGDLILVTLRDFEQTKRTADVIHRYTPEEHFFLKNKGIVNFETVEEKEVNESELFVFDDL